MDDNDRMKEAGEAHESGMAIRRTRRSGLEALGLGVLWACISIALTTLSRFNLLDNVVPKDITFMCRLFYEGLERHGNLGHEWARLVLFLIGVVVLVFLFGWLPWIVASILQAVCGVEIFKDTNRNARLSKDMEGN